MSTANRFEDLEVWAAAYELVQQIYRISNESTFARDFSLKDQIRRASTSVMSNVGEGFARRSTIEFIRFLDIARSSAVEVQSLLYVARSQGYISDELFRASYEQCQTLRFKIGAFMRYLRTHAEKH